MHKIANCRAGVVGAPSLILATAFPAAANSFPAYGPEGQGYWTDPSNTLSVTDTSNNGAAVIVQLIRPAGSVVSVAAPSNSSNSRVINLDENEGISMRVCRYNYVTEDVSNCGPFYGGTSR